VGPLTLFIIVFGDAVLVVIFYYLFQNMLRVVAHGHQWALIAVDRLWSPLLHRVGPAPRVHRGGMSDPGQCRVILISIPAVAFDGHCISHISIHGISHCQIGPKR
jgi:hypothetical protein